MELMARYFIRRVRSIGIRDRPTSPRSPWQNAYAERLIGSIRRECLDHIVVFGERQAIARSPRAFVISLGGFGRLALQLREFRCHRRIRAGQLLDRHVLRLVVRQA
ncbi:integrase core domain-containing protein [Nitrobacter sp. TKz-YC02]|uniref:integrase core domain-containing protein n=1 Tax=Nitrobacter sp. TKz-YC02 TaxID=3398704 RepID=UPI003CEB0540